MTGVPAPTLYHRWLGWHAPAMRRALTAFIVGLIVAVVLLPFVTWGLALVGGWDAAALTVLLDHLADHYPSRQLTRAGTGWPRRRDTGLG